MNGHFPFGDIRPGRYFFGSAALIGLLFSFISEDTEQPYLLNLLQWQMQTLLPMAILIFTHIRLANIAWLKHINAWLQVLLSGLVASAVFTPIALFIEVILTDERLEQGLFVSLVHEFFGMSPPVILTWLLLNTPWLLGGTYVKQAAEKSAQPPRKQDATSDDLPKFYQLLAVEKRGELLAVSAELHYIKVYTDKGNSLILYALKDAMAEIPDSLGMQVHRSYWASHKILNSYKKQGRQGLLVVANGETIPVSRNYVAQVLAWQQKHRPDTGSG